MLRTVKVSSYVLSIGVVTGMLVGTPERLHAQQTSAAPVRVTNSASAPVPVTGNVTATVAGDVNATVTGNVNATVSGNVNATVTGPVALASGATVTVGNSTNSPVPVVDVGSARLPLQGPLRSCVFDYTHGACGVDAYARSPRLSARRRACDGVSRRHPISA